MSVASQDGGVKSEVSQMEDILVRNRTTGADEQYNAHTLTANTQQGYDDSLNSPIDSAETREGTYLPPTWNQPPTSTGNKTTVF